MIPALMSSLREELSRGGVESNSEDRFFSLSIGGRLSAIFGTNSPENESDPESGDDEEDEDEDEEEDEEFDSEEERGVTWPWMTGWRSWIAF